MSIPWENTKASQPTNTVQCIQLLLLNQVDELYTKHINCTTPL